MYANQVCSRIRRAFCKRSHPKSQENHLNGVWKALGGVLDYRALRRERGCVAIRSRFLFDGGFGLGDSRSARIDFYFLAQDDRLGNFSHRLPFLPALLLQCQIGLFLAQSQFALQNPLGAFHNFSRL